MREVAEQCAKKAHYAARALAEAGAPRLHRGDFFREFAVSVPGRSSGSIDLGLARGFLAGVPLRRLDPGFPDGLLVAVTERRTREEIDRLAAVVADLGATATAGAPAPGAKAGKGEWAEAAKR